MATQKQGSDKTVQPQLNKPGTLAVMSALRYLHNGTSPVVWFLIVIVYASNVYLYFTPLYMTSNTTQCAPVGQVQKPKLTPGPALSVVPRTSSTLAEVKCHPGTPCEYPEVTDLRILVLTYSRHTSLQKLLLSLNSLDLDGDSAILEIWIDRGKDGQVDSETVQTARGFHWQKGPTRVHIHSKHVGIYGQWIDTWRPPVNTTEMALILEDDLSVSPYAYRWLKAIQPHVRNRSDIGGCTLQSENVNKATGRGPINPPKGDTVYLYQLLGSWGFAPHPKTWRAFQDWYHEKEMDASFHPYVDGLVMTNWYKKFEKEQKQDSMWTMWYIYYTHEQGLYTVYSNLKAHVGSAANRLATNRFEPGLHFQGRGQDNSDKLLRMWKASYAQFPKDVVQFDFSGKSVQK